MAQSKRCECGNAITIRTHPKRNPRSHRGAKYIRDHDLCRRCFRALMSRLRAEQRDARAEFSSGG